MKKKLLIIFLVSSIAYSCNKTNKEDLYLFSASIYTDSSGIQKMDFYEDSLYSADFDNAILNGMQKFFISFASKYNPEYSKGEITIFKNGKELDLTNLPPLTESKFEETLKPLIDSLNLKK